MFALAGELIAGFALGIEFLGREHFEDDYSYVVIELGIIRLVLSYDHQA